MKLSDFSFNLPEELIAKFAASPRDHSKLLVVYKETQRTDHLHFFDLPELLKPSDLLVVNNTKVLPARIFGKDAQNRVFEVFLLKSLNTSKTTWSCLVKPGKKVKSGIEISFPKEVRGFIRPSNDQLFEVNFTAPENQEVVDWIYEHGESPLPPYIKRKAETTDKATYQTVYAKNSGSVAAPTAGLHFTERLLEQLKTQGVETAEVTLHVGYGTFSPIRTENILDHKMHTEEYEIPKETTQKIEATQKRGNRIIAVGTTSLRTLESYPRFGASAATDIYITPGYELKMANSLITNFHLPESSLYVLVSSLLGLDFCREVYREAISKKYRFYSYGDAMIIL